MQKRLLLSLKVPERITLLSFGPKFVLVSISWQVLGYRGKVGPREFEKKIIFVILTSNG
jgi:hypothetical protein